MLTTFPTFIIPGAGKSGTSSLASYLARHPDVSITTPKEPSFFVFADGGPEFKSPEMTDLKIVSDPVAYQRLFDARAAARGDASTYYLLMPERAIGNIRRLIPGYKAIKIVILLRNPVDRAFSNYTMFNMKGWESLPFKEAISPRIIKERLKSGWSPSYDYLDEGLYYRRVLMFKEAFDNVRIFLFEDLSESAERVVSDTLAFIGVDPRTMPEIDYQRVNASGSIRSQLIHRLTHEDGLIRRIIRPAARLFMGRERRANLADWIGSVNLKRLTIDSETRRYLVDYYRDDVLRLETLIERDLGAWRADE